jgi:chromate transporter
VGWLLFGATTVWMVRTKWSPLWPIAAGAMAGALGWV